MPFDAPKGPPSRRRRDELMSLVEWPLVVERTVRLSGRRVRLRLESAVWDGLGDAARRKGKPLAELCGEIDAERPSDMPLSTALRTFALTHFQRLEAGR